MTKTFYDGAKCQMKEYLNITMKCHLCFFFMSCFSKTEDEEGKDNGTDSIFKTFF